MLKWLKKLILPIGIARLFWAFLMFSFFAFVVISVCHFIDTHTSEHVTSEISQCCSEKSQLRNASPNHLTVISETTLPGNPPVALSTAIAFTLFFFVWPVRDKRKHVEIMLRNRLLRWVWARSLPFASDGKFLPYFFATHGA